MGKINNRIEKYAKLRERVDQEIKVLQLKKENFAKINHFQSKVDKIDDKIFVLAGLKATAIFGDFSNLIDVEQAKEDSNLDKFREELNDAESKIEGKLRGHSDKKTQIADFVPDFANEDLINKQIEVIEKNRNQIDEKYNLMMEQKYKISEKAKHINDSFFDEKNVFQDIISTQKKIEARENSIDFWKNIRKKKTKWLFWSCLVSLFFLVICLFILLLTSGE